MPLEIQRFPDEPIIVFRATGPIDPAVQQPQQLDEVKKLKQEIGGHVYRIIDLTNARFDFSQVVSGMANERNQEGGMNDPDITTLMIASSEIIQIAVTSAKTEQYGSANTHLFPTIEAALAYARAEISSK